MSAYNLARYNAAKFNVYPTSDIWLDARSRITFGFSYAGITNYVKGNASIWFLSDNMSIDPGKFIYGSGQMIVSNQSIANRYFWEESSAVTVFSEEINLSQEAFAIGTESTAFDLDANLSQEVFDNGIGSTSFDPEINLSQEAFVTGNAGEVFSQTADVISLTESVCSFPGLTLKPGQTLIIDSGSYNILLNGINAIHLQQGDWLDNLSRDTINITASATGASRLQIQIIYVERYL